MTPPSFLPTPPAPAAFVPVLPESAPFTPEQRAYLNGFLAGLFSFAPVPSAPAATTAASALRPLAILYGSQTGTAEKLAKRAAKEAGKRGFAATLHDLSRFQPADLAGTASALILASTYGDGEPPDGARAFWSTLKGEGAPRLERLRFSVCALGDQNYPRFCQFGRDLDARLEGLGAQRVHLRQDCDTDVERPFQTWLAGALASFGAGPDGPSPATRQADEVVDDEPPGYSASRPCPARLKTNRRLSGEGSAKDVRHFEIALLDSNVAYEAGDALGVWPVNCPEFVTELLNTLGARGDEPVPGRDDQTVALRLALEAHYEIGRIPPALLTAVAAQTRDPLLVQVASPDANGERQKFLHGRDILDLLLSHPDFRPEPAAFIATLRKLQPRLYSISSSPKTHPREVHLTVNAVRYESLGRARRGVASCFLADRCPAERELAVYVHTNTAFRLPADDVPLVMIGPGTGVAPFRAFLQERRARGAAGRNWLLFGDQHAATDFLYREEIEAFRHDGVLTHLDLAWSRDQGDKVYVQHRLLEKAAELWRWLEEGATVAVCGDAARMAKDVDTALHQVIRTAGGLTADAAREYVTRLQGAQRYLRDVY